MTFPNETVTKIEAARRQLREAIVMFFERRDMIAVHTLAAASLQVLTDVGASKGIYGFLKGDLHVIREDKKKEVRQVLSEAQNFFKHADKDPDGSHDFKPNATPLYLLDAAQLEQQLCKTLQPASGAYLVWAALKYPDTLDENFAKAVVEKADTVGLKSDDFDVFLKLIFKNEKKA